MTFFSAQTSLLPMQFLPMPYGAIVSGTAPTKAAPSPPHFTIRGFTNEGVVAAHSKPASASQDPHQKNTAGAQHSGVTKFPPAFAAGEKPVHTYASFYEEPVTALASNAHGTWYLCLPIGIPKDISNPTLTSLTYFIKYATTQDSGDATIQADIAFSTVASEGGIVVGAGAHVDGFYRVPRSSYGPWLVNPDVTLGLSSKAAIKKNDGGPSWSHFIDQTTISQAVSVGDAGNLYLLLHVVEYPTAQTLRALAVEVAASWSHSVDTGNAEDIAHRAREEAENRARLDRQRREAERKAQEEADRKARGEEEARKKAQEDAERKALEDAERKAADRRAQEDMARKGREEDGRKAADRKAKEDEARKAREEAERKAKEEADRRAQEDAARKPKIEKKPQGETVRRAKEEAVKNAPPVADHKMQAVIADAAKKFGAECEQGFAWQKTPTGYQCAGGGHKLTFEQLGMA